jgi:hypothetical protein
MAAHILKEIDNILVGGEGYYSEVKEGKRRSTYIALFY